MLNGKFKGQDIGSGTHVMEVDEDMKTGKITQQRLSWMPKVVCRRSAGHCMTMGTASTMACMVESLGLTLSVQLLFLQWIQEKK